MWWTSSSDSKWNRALRNESELTNQGKEFWIEGRINEVVNQEGENGFEGTKKKPANGTQKERKYDLQVR